MKHFLTNVVTSADVDAFLEQPALRQAAGSSRAILAQIFFGHTEAEWLGTLLERLRKALPSAVMVGASSSGEIAAGRVLEGTTVISLLCFDSSSLHPLQRACPRGTEYATGVEIGHTLSHLPDLRGVLLLAPPPPWIAPACSVASNRNCRG